MRHLVDAGRPGRTDRASTARAPATGTWAIRRTGAAGRWARRAASRCRASRSQFTAADFARYDHVLAMDRANRDELLRMAPDRPSAPRCALLRSFDPSAPPDADVPDPYYGGARGFEEVFDICERACRGLLDHLRRAHGA